MADDLEQRLRALKANLPDPRGNLSSEQKAELIKAVGGPATAESIVKAMKELPLERIPFLFSSLDSQLVVDIMANDMQAAIAEAKLLKKKRY